MLGLLDRKLDQRLRRFGWYLRHIDEAPNTTTRKEFTWRWARQSGESVRALRLRHQLILEELREDLEDRRSSLASVNQTASVTLAALSLVLGLVLVSGTVNADSPLAKLIWIVVAVLQWQLIGSYMPNRTKGKIPFMDAGVYVLRYAIRHTPRSVHWRNGGKPGRKKLLRREAYVGEFLLRSRAESMVYKLNVRNRILNRARGKLGDTHLLIRIVIMAGLVFILYPVAARYL